MAISVAAAAVSRAEVDWVMKLGHERKNLCNGGERWRKTVFVFVLVTLRLIFLRSIAKMVVLLPLIETSSFSLFLLIFPPIFFLPKQNNFNPSRVFLNGIFTNIFQ